MLKKQQEQTEKTQNNPGNKIVALISLAQIATSTTLTKTTTTKKLTELKKSQKLFVHPVRDVGKQTTPQRNASLETMQLIDPAQKTGKTESGPRESQSR